MRFYKHPGHARRDGSSFVAETDNSGDWGHLPLDEELPLVDPSMLGAWDDDDVHRLLCCGCVRAWLANGLSCPKLVRWIGIGTPDECGHIPDCENCAIVARGDEPPTRPGDKP